MFNDPCLVLTTEPNLFRGEKPKTPLAYYFLFKTLFYQVRVVLINIWGKYVMVSNSNFIFYYVEVAYSVEVDKSCFKYRFMKVSMSNMHM